MGYRRREAGEGAEDETREDRRGTRNRKSGASKIDESRIDERMGGKGVSQMRGDSNNN